MTSTTLPSRPSVRAVIVKGNRICLCKKLDKEGKNSYYVFPGGGIEEGQSQSKAVEVECLEEVGIVVTNVLYLGLTDEQRDNVVQGERAKQFGGIKNYYFMATYSREDKSLYNSQGDALEYEWLTIPEAIKKITKGPESVFSKSRIAALKLVEEYLSGKKQNKNFQW